MMEEEVNVHAAVSGWILGKVECARDLVYSYCFYADEHRELVKDNVGHAAAILGDVIELLQDAARSQKNQAPLQTSKLSN